MDNFDVLKAYQQGFKEGKEQLKQENEKLKDDLKWTRELLEKLEWSYDGGNKCPVCYGTLQDVGHNKWCWLKAELDKIKVVE